MSKKPFVVRNIFEPHILLKIQEYVSRLKERPELAIDNNVFKRKLVHNDPFFNKFHETIIALTANEVFEEDLIPSYNFLSLYKMGLGECPIHVDRSQCYLTIDVCLQQNEPWPIYVNSEQKYSKLEPWEISTFPKELQDQIKKNSQEFLLNPGDAVCYSGTRHPHWRNQIQHTNYCDLIFFHFVPKDFKGELL
jgi:hypothetical protein